MLRRNFAFALASSALLALVATDASAAAQRTFVSSYGSPANTAFNCSIAKPCRAFSEAIGVTNPAGEVIVLDSAGYGPVTITKSVSVIVPTGIYGGISVLTGDGVTVNAPGAIVVLRGLSINGQGGLRGIVLQAAARVRIENCVVSGMNSAGISHNAPNAEMIVLDTIIRDNGGAGVDVNADLPYAVLDRVRSEHNGGDGFYLAPAPGSVGGYATVVDSAFAHNDGHGIYAKPVVSSTVTIVVERTVMASNGKRGFLGYGDTGTSLVVTIARSTVNHNSLRGISVIGDNTIASILGNVVHRNGEFGLQLIGFGRTQLLLKDNIANAHTIHDLDCDIVDGFINTDRSNVVQTAYLSPPICNGPTNGGI